MSRTVIINGREYPEAIVGLALGSGIAIGEAIREISYEPARPDVGAAVRAGIAAARALDPKPRNRHERRALAAKRRRNGL